MIFFRQFFPKFVLSSCPSLYSDSCVFPTRAGVFCDGGVLCNSFPVLSATVTGLLAENTAAPLKKHHPKQQLMRVSWRACMFALDFKDLVWLTLCRSNHKTPRHTSTAESVLMIAVVWLKHGGLKFHLRVCGSISNLYCMLKTCVKPCLKNRSLMIFDAQIPKKDAPLVWSNQTTFFFRNALPIFFFEFTSPYAEEISTLPWLFQRWPFRQRSSAVAWRAAMSWRRSSSSCDRNSPEPLRRAVEDPYGSLWLMFIIYITFIARYSRWT